MTTIILNAESINALFPEGTETRIKLQSTVLEQMVKQSIRTPARFPDLEQALSRAINEFREVAEVNLGLIRKHYGYGLSIHMTEAIKEHLKTEAFKFAESAAVDAINKAVVPRVQNLEGLVNLEVRRQVAEKLAAMTKLASLPNPLA